MTSPCAGWFLYCKLLAGAAPVTREGSRGSQQRPQYHSGRPCLLMFCIVDAVSDSRDSVLCQRITPILNPNIFLHYTVYVRAYELVCWLDWKIASKSKGWKR